METTNKRITTSVEERLATINRALPFSDEGERGLLSCLMQDPMTRIPETRPRVPEEAFYHEAYGIIFHELIEMWENHVGIDPMLLTHRLRDKNLLDKVGGAAQITELFAFVPITAHYPFYTKIVQDKWQLRELISVASQIIEDVYIYAQEQVDVPVMEVVARAESLVFARLESARNLSQHAGGAQDAMTATLEWVDHMEVVMNNQGKITGLPSGLLELDQAFHGFDDQEGEIVTIAARPSMGKSSEARTIADYLAVEKGIPGCVFSIEESKTQWLGKQILGGAGIDTSKAITGHFGGTRGRPANEHYEAILPSGEYAAWQQRAVQVAKSPMFINADSWITTSDLRAQVQVLKRQHNIRWIMVDHLHLVKAANPKNQSDERMRLVEVMETLQFLKKEHHIVIFLMVQMNRDTDKNPGKPPVLSDLSGSAAIEQYSDHVIFIHREDFYQKWHKLSQDEQDSWRAMAQERRERSPELWSDGNKYSDEEGGFARQDYEEKALLYVRKNRRGPTPEIQVRFQREFTRFSTRMPCLNSQNPLDWAMGTYTPKRVKPAPQSAGDAMKGRKSYKKKEWSAADPDWHKEFTDPSDD